MQQLGGGVTLDPRLLKVVIIGPKQKAQVEGKGENVDVVRIALCDELAGLRQSGSVNRLLYYRYRQGGYGQEQGIERQALFSRENDRVFLDLGESYFSR